MFAAAVRDIDGDGDGGGTASSSSAADPRTASGRPAACRVRAGTRRPTVAAALEQSIPEVLDKARRLGVDPEHLLANFMVESYRCLGIAGAGGCRMMQNFQKEHDPPVVGAGHRGQLRVASPRASGQLGLRHPAGVGVASA